MIGRAVTDTACLVALERVGHLDILPRVFTQVLAPPAVGAELGKAVPWLAIQAPTHAAVLAALATQVGAGEAGVIALGLEIREARVILDDKKARAVARRAGLPVIGTLAVLLLAKRQGVLSRVEPILTALREARFYMTPGLYREALRLATEEPTE